MIKKWILVIMVVLLAGQIAWASEEEIAELKKEVAEMQKKLKELETQQSEQADLSKRLKWLDRWEFSGDFRYRYEYIDDDQKSEDRNRNRIRARIKLKAKVNDQTDFIFRIATGGDDPVSTNQTLEDSFSSKDIKIDQAYIDWHPGDFSAYFGKMANPFIRVGKNELIYDSDLTPEGVAFNYTSELSDSTALLVNGGGFYVNEEDDGADTSLWGLQGAIDHEMPDTSNLLVGVSYYYYGNLEGEAAVFDDDFFGNSFVEVAGPNVYEHDYRLLEGFVEYDFEAGDVPMSLYGNYVVNTTSGVSEDTGWMVGTKLLDAEKPGDMEFGYSYRELQADAVLGTYSDSDFIGGGTNGKGHQFGVKYKVAKNMDAGLTYFLNDKGDDDDRFDRVQFDLKFKF